MDSTTDVPSLLAFHRIRAVARLLGLDVSIDGSSLKLALDTSAASPTPSWSSGEITRADHLSRSGPVPGGLACPAIFGDLHEPDLRRFGHIRLPCFVVPLPARQILAPLLDDTESELLAHNVTNPDALLLRIKSACVAEQTVLGHSLLEFVWWSVPVISPILRAEDPAVALVMNGETCFTHALHDPYRRVMNRAFRVRRLMELGAPAVILDNERRMLICAVDELLVNADLDAPRVSSGDEPVPAFDALRLFFAALGNKLVEIGERNARTAVGSKLWITEAAQIGREQGRDARRLLSLWRLAAERPAEPLNAEMCAALTRSLESC